MAQDIKIRSLILVWLLLACANIPFSSFAQKGESSLYDYKAKTLTGTSASLSQYKGKVSLVTNIALKCGTTPQLTELQSLYEEFKDRGFTVLGFPSNDFTGIEPSDPGEIHTACATKYGVTFPLFSPGAVSGTAKQVVFMYLTQSGSESIKGEVSFNFEKFLVDKNGKVRDRFGPFTGAVSAIIKKRVDELLSE